ncbi:hypothetical protein [Nocardioides sp. SYSU DS0663]|uniref:hypothetical protein n=1 Tax=Nocardioides sp. SYSU DS0663 TaxID=3416445 RepID=UPI003F4B60FA
MTGVHLTRTAENVDQIDALARRHGGRVGLAGVVSQLDRRLRRTWAPCLSRHRAWTWDAADRRDPAWWPQGVSTADRADTAELGRAGDRLLVVSWYAKAGGSRLSFLDLAARRYAHVLLAVPTHDGWTPLRVHAGGIAWHGKHVYVAATGRGFWTCHTDDIIATPEGLVLPVRFGYRAAADDGVERLRYSFLSVDSTSTPQRLVVGEYGSRRQTRRLAHVALDPATGLPATDAEGVARPSVLESGVVRAQGVVVAAGDHHLSASHGPWVPGSLWSGRPGDLRERRFALPMGPEDLDWSPVTDRLWTVTEHPRRRWIVSLRR